MPRIILADDSASVRTLLALRLREKGFDVVDAPDAATAAELAIAEPPTVVITDLWMPGISGVQLCRLLRSEPATAHVPVILLTASSDRRSRFWARCAGAAAYVTKSDVDQLLEAVASVVSRRPSLPPPTAPPRARGSVQERLSQLLDTALYESTIAGEIRALAQNDADLEGIFTALAHLASDVVSYRWLALAPNAGRLLLHSHPSTRLAVENEARAALRVDADANVFAVEDARALEGDCADPPLVALVHFGAAQLGTIALGPNRRGASIEDRKLLALFGAELGGPMRIAGLVDEARRLARTDALTGLMNRRAFIEAMGRERSRTERHAMPISLLLLDVDHFKKVNDTYGHDAGDVVLRGVASVLMKIGRKSDFVARWGGEEFVIALAQTAEGGARIAAERVRRAIAEARFPLQSGEVLTATASVGLASSGMNWDLEDLIERADKAMYAAKNRGRNRVEMG